MLPNRAIGARVQRAALVRTLLGSREPSVRWRLLVGWLGEDPRSPAMRRLQDEIRVSPRVRSMLTGLGVDEHPRRRGGTSVYAKWQGPHWILAALADIGYPDGDELLGPIGQRVLEYWLQPDFYTDFDAQTRAAAYRKPGVVVMRGRHRRCASQQGNALYSLTRLGLAAEHTHRLVERLLHWQWPDGGWNCDKNPVADTSSFMETLFPMCGLHLYGQQMHSDVAVEVARRAAEVFLTRRLFRRRSDGEVIHPEFLRVHYPLYWHYDILGGLKALARVGLVTDPRCGEALDLLERKELPGGGWAAERRYYTTTTTTTTTSDIRLSADHVDWGGTSLTRMNEWVTTDALYVLRQAGRA
jgi:hypothetical protein